MKYKSVFSIKYLVFSVFFGALIVASFAHAQFELFENLLEAPRSEEENDFALDLVWEASTHVPPEYAGKALPSAGSIIVVSALTPTKNAAGLTFSWSVEDSSNARRIEHASLSQNQFAYRAEGILPNFEHIISVRVDEQSTGQSARGRVEIPVHNPETTVRAISPSGALLEPTVSLLTLPAGSSLSLLARTFFFTAEPTNLAYSWIFDGERASGSGNPERLDLSISSSSGSATKNLILEILLPDTRERAVSTVKIEID